VCVCVCMCMCMRVCVRACALSFALSHIKTLTNTAIDRCRDTTLRPMSRTPPRGVCVCVCMCVSYVRVHDCACAYAHTSAYVCVCRCVCSVCACLLLTPSYFSTSQINNAPTPKRQANGFAAFIQQHFHSAKQALLAPHSGDALACV